MKFYQNVLRVMFKKFCARGRLLFFILYFIAIGVLICLLGDGVRLIGPVEDTTEWLRSSRNLTTFILPDANSAIVEALQPIQCKFSDRIAVIYFVTTSPKNRANRRVIRETWGRHIRPKPIFFMGLTDDAIDMELAINEAKLYGDVVIENFNDSYQNLTVKTGFMLKHFLTICPTATYLMKIDDDMFLNTEVVNTIVSDVVGKEQLPLLGKMFDEYRPHRDRESKWYLPYWLYRHPKFPAYLSGTGYLIPGTEVGNILKEASKIPIIPLEDVFYNGLIAGKHLGLKLQHDRRFRDDRPLYKSYHCLYRNVATVHRISPLLLQKLWDDRLLKDAECSGVFSTVMDFLFGLV